MVAAWLGLGVLTHSALALGQVPSTVPATGQTTAFPTSNPSVADSAIWIHPTDPGQSRIFAVDGQSGLLGYDLAGTQTVAVPGPFTSVDVRYHVPLGGQSVSLLVAGTSSATGDGGKLHFFTVDASTGALAEVTGNGQSFGGRITCVRLYHPPGAATFDLWVVGAANGGTSVKHWRLSDSGTGQVQTQKRRPR